MSYTPKFQEVLDKVEQMEEADYPIKEIQEFFKESVKNLGAYERINNLYRIRPKRPVPGQKSRMQFFRMNKMQDKFYKGRTNRDLILKMRQGGVTTLSCLIALDKALWEDNTNSAIMAHVQPNVKKYFRITKAAYNWFKKDWGGLYPVTDKVDNVNELQIAETGSSLIVCTESKGLTLDFLHIAEACFVDDDRISESVESVPLSAWVIMESTPDTASGMFFDIWELGENEEMSLYTNHFYGWWFQYPEEEDLELLKNTKELTYENDERHLVETFDLTDVHIIWRRLKISEAGGDKGEFQRKYPEDPIGCFLAGSSSVFPAGLIQNLFKQEKRAGFYGRLSLS